MRVQAVLTTVENQLQRETYCDSPTHQVEILYEKCKHVFLLPAYTGRPATAGPRCLGICEVVSVNDHLLFA